MWFRIISHIWIHMWLMYGSEFPIPEPYITHSCNNTLDILTFFTRVPWSKVPLSLPAPKCEYGIFGPHMMKNRIRNMGIKRATPDRAHVCHPRLWLGWQFTRALDWPTLYLPCCVIYLLYIVNQNLCTTN